jgi:hypothetical protein
MATRRRPETLGRLPSGRVLVWMWAWAIAIMLALTLASGPQAMAVSL